MMVKLVVILNTSIAVRTICSHSKGSVSLVPRPKEEEKKGPGFSCLRMCLIILDLIMC